MSGLRVIAGSAQGRRLRSVPGSSTRPITDRVKEAFFNILGADVQSANFLDLFAGTGSVGIEALSRGAAKVRLIDIDRLAVATIRANLELTGLEEQAEVQRVDAFAFLERVPDCTFDCIYIAPPQYKEQWIRALLSLDVHPAWLSEDAWVIVQIHPREYEQLGLQNLSEFDQRRYGNTVLVFFETFLTE